MGGLVGKWNRGWLPCRPPSMRSRPPSQSLRTSLRIVGWWRRSSARLRKTRPTREEEETANVEMVGEEERGNPESSGPRMEANTEDIPPLVSGGDTVSPEEEVILLDETPQPEDPATGSRSPRSETAMVSGGMAELCLASLSHPGSEEDETPP